MENILSTYLEDAAKLIIDAQVLCEAAQKMLKRKDDLAAIKVIITDLTWAAENCTVMLLHQQGKALEDNMGYNIKEIK